MPLPDPGSDGDMPPARRHGVDACCAEKNPVILEELLTSFRDRLVLSAEQVTHDIRKMPHTDFG